MHHRSKVKGFSSSMGVPAVLEKTGFGEGREAFRKQKDHALLRESVYRKGRVLK
jgi:hypothetical protein